MDEKSSPALVRLGKNVKIARIEADFTQEQACLEAGLTRGNWSKLERGELNASAKTIIRVAVALGVDPGSLFAGTVAASK